HSAPIASSEPEHSPDRIGVSSALTITAGSPAGANSPKVAAIVNNILFILDMCFTSFFLNISYVYNTALNHMQLARLTDSTGLFGRSCIISLASLVRLRQDNSDYNLRQQHYDYAYNGV